MRKLFIDVQIRDAKGKLYKDRDGNPIARIAKLEINNNGEEMIKSFCQQTSKNFEAISKEGSKVHIDVMYYDSISDTYPIIYSFYGAENKFVKH
jgi:hypothetical protein